MQSFALLGRLLVWSAVALGMIGIAVWFVRRIRGDVLAQKDSAEQAEHMLREFTAMRADGRLDDEEYRAIRDRLRSVSSTRTGFSPAPERK